MRLLLANIYTKTIRDNRAGMLGWGLGIAAIMVIGSSQYGQIISGTLEERAYDATGTSGRLDNVPDGDDTSSGLAGIANGGITCENPPGIRNSPFGDLYLAYLRDPAGNKLCGAHRLPRD